MNNIAIIGGGMAGFGAAYELVQNNVSNITVFEKSACLGGLAATVCVSGERLEVFYHHMYPSYHDFLEIAKNMGITDKIFFKRAKSGIFYKGKIFPFDTPLDLVRFSPLNLWERFKTGIVLAQLKCTRTWKKFEGVGADEWLRIHLGEKAYAILWEPLLSSKFEKFYKDIGMTWFWGKIYERPAKFGYFHGSFSTLIDALEKYLKTRGVNFVLREGVKNIEKNDGGKFVVTTDNTSKVFDQVIVATPPVPFMELASHLLPREFSNYVTRFKYLGTICAILVLKQPLTNLYWLNINEKNFPFLGVIEQSNFISPETYGGYHPIYLPKYLDAESDFYRLSDEEIWSKYLPALKRINTEFREDWIVEKYIFRAPFTQPVITKNYGEIRPAYSTPITGLWWVSMSHIYPWDRGTDHAFHSGRELVREMLNI